MAPHKPSALFDYLLREWLLFGAALGVIVTSAYLRRIPEYTFQDLEIIYILFVLFVIIKGLEHTGFFSALAAGFASGKHIPIKLVLATMFLSMWVTNDIALLIVVPLTLQLRTVNKGKIVIFEVLAANAGSALTPFGNPQNLFLYWFYHLHPHEFVVTIAPFFLVFLALLVAGAAFIKVTNHRSDSVSLRPNKRAYWYLLLLVLFVLTIFRVLPVALGIGIVLYALIFDRKSLRVDYALLASFVCFFGFADNIKVLLAAEITNSKHIFLLSAMLSQFMSNVPATVLLADFTVNWKALLWGVSVGGFGSIVGSLANLIGYKLYVNSPGDSPGQARKFFITFSVYGYAAFLVGIGVYYLFVV